MGGARAEEPDHECIWPQKQGLGREAWVVICVQQRHHPHLKFKPAHKARQSLFPWFHNSIPTVVMTVTCFSLRRSGLLQILVDLNFNLRINYFRL